MSWSKRKNEAASLPMQQPIAPVVHNHPKGYGGVVAVVFVCACIGIALGYLGIVALAADAGSANPRRDVAQGLLWIVLGGGGLYCASVAGGKLYANFQDQKRKTLAMVHEFELERTRLQLQAATTMPTGASDRLTNDSDYTKSQLALAVLQIAYQHGTYKPNEARPWVRDRAYSLGVPGVTSAMAAGLAAWMTGNGLLVDNQVNVAKYDSWEAARRMLARRYAPAVLVNAHTPLSDGDSYSIINGVK